MINAFMLCIYNGNKSYIKYLKSKPKLIHLVLYLL